VWVIVHLFVGLAFGAAMEAPFWLVALAVLASHVLLDLIPHWDYTRGRHNALFGWLDFLCASATLVTCHFVWHTPLAVLALGTISAAPDFDVLLHTLRGEHGRKWFPSHWDRFPHGACGPVPGITVQVAVMAAATAVFFVAGAR
jgi:hypothetical protein